MARELSRVQSGNGDEQEQDGDIEGEIEGVPNVPSSQRERDRDRERGGSGDSSRCADIR